MSRSIKLSQVDRLVYAVVLIAAFFVLLCFAGCRIGGTGLAFKEFVSALGETDASPGVLDGVQEQSLMDQEPLAFLKKVLGDDASSSGEVPPDFEQECFDLPCNQEVWVHQERSVLGFSLPESPEEAFERLSDELQSKGWVQVSSGLSGMGSFLKEDGSYASCLLSCTAVGSGTTVVFQYIEATN